MGCYGSYTEAQISLCPKAATTDALNLFLLF